MAKLDSHVAEVLDAADSDDEDPLIAALEETDSPALDAFREQRIRQLHAELMRAKDQQGAGFGHYTEIKDEKVVMDMTTSIKYAVVHFAKDDFARCGIMDSHLQTLAEKHFDTRFIKINVENAPFLVTKLKIQVLPCVLAFVNGVSVDRIVGFEGLGYTPVTFNTKDLEARLVSSGVVQRVKTTQNTGPVSLSSKSAKHEDSGDDDWD